MTPEAVDTGILFYVDTKKLGRYLRITLKCAKEHITKLDWELTEKYPCLPTMKFCTTCGHELHIWNVVASKEKP